jgi:two-component system cell cycle sensor histidine kinase/response regulator CckA
MLDEKMEAGGPPPGVQDSYRVLILDDDADLGSMLSDYLRLSGPYLPRAATSVQAMWQILPAEAFDVLLLDYHLPDGDGLSVLSELGKRGYHLPVVMITGEGDEYTAVQAIQRGAVDYVVKDGTFEFVRSLPGVVQKAIQYHSLQVSAQDAFEKIRYQAFLLNSVQDAVVVWDLQGKIAFWNYAAQNIFGWRSEDQIGRSVDERYFPYFVPPMKADEVRAWLGQEIEHQYRAPGKEMVWVSSRITALYERISPDEITGYMNVSRDVSERKRMELQVQAAQTQLMQSVRLAAIGELASGVAHQINNPLTTIIADAQLLVNQLPHGHPALESAHAIQQAGWRTQKVVQLLMEYSQPSGSAMEVLALNQTIENAVTLVGAQVHAAGGEVKTELIQPSPHIFGRRSQLEDLWVHLLLMARDAVRASPATNGVRTIHIKSYRMPATNQSQQVVVEFHDHGKTIPPEHLHSVFEPNFLTSLNERGSGIEMSICREIVRQLHGQIEVHSQPAQGTTIRVQFPAKG